MLELYDDRVKQVEPNTGIVIDEELQRVKKELEDMTMRYKAADDLAKSLYEGKR